MPEPGSAKLDTARRRTLSLLTATLLAGCGSGRAPGGDRVTVFAASSLASVLPQILASAPARAMTRVRTVFAASSMLARQIEAGAPADLFFCADEAWMRRLVSRGWLNGLTTVEPFSNRLLLVAPARHRDRWGERQLEPVLRSLRAGDHVVIGDPAHVPSGRYARAALEALSLWPQVAPHAVYADSARAALALVDRGEADLGVVYATDRALSRNVHVVADIPSAPRLPVRYVLAQSSSLTAAEADVRAVYGALLDEAAMRVYRGAGFVPL